MVNNLHNDDTLWYWAANASHKFMEWRGKGVMDLVLHCIFAMGFNWHWGQRGSYLGGKLRVF